MAAINAIFTLLSSRPHKTNKINEIKMKYDNFRFYLHITLSLTRNKNLSKLLEKKDFDMNDDRLS